MKNINNNIISRIISRLISFIITIVLRLIFTRYWSYLKLKVDLSDFIGHYLDQYNKVFLDKGLVGLYKFISHNKDRIRKSGFDDVSNWTIVADSGKDYVQKVDMIKKLLGKVHLTVSTLMHLKIVIQLIFNVLMIPFVVMYLVSFFRTIIVMTSVASSGLASLMYLDVKWDYFNLGPYKTLLEPYYLKAKEYISNLLSYLWKTSMPADLGLPEGAEDIKPLVSEAQNPTDINIVDSKNQSSTYKGYLPYILITCAVIGASVTVYYWDDINYENIKYVAVTSYVAIKDIIATFLDNTPPADDDDSTPSSPHFNKDGLPEGGSQTTNHSDSNTSQDGVHTTKPKSKGYLKDFRDRFSSEGKFYSNWYKTADGSETYPFAGSSTEGGMDTEARNLAKAKLKEMAEANTPPIKYFLFDEDSSTPGPSSSNDSLDDSSSDKTVKQSNSKRKGKARANNPLREYDSKTETWF